MVAKFASQSEISRPKTHHGGASDSLLASSIRQQSLQNSAIILTARPALRLLDKLRSRFSTWRALAAASEPSLENSIDLPAREAY
jgi:hypothetical protein